MGVCADHHGGSTDPGGICGRAGAADDCSAGPFPSPPPLRLRMRSLIAKPFGFEPFEGKGSCVAKLHMHPPKHRHRSLQVPLGGDGPSGAAASVSPAAHLPDYMAALANLQRAAFQGALVPPASLPWPRHADEAMARSIRSAQGNAADATVCMGTDQKRGPSCMQANRPHRGAAHSHRGQRRSQATPRLSPLQQRPAVRQTRRQLWQALPSARLRLLPAALQPNPQQHPQQHLLRPLRRPVWTQQRLHRHHLAAHLPALLAPHLQVAVAAAAHLCRPYPRGAAVQLHPGCSNPLVAAPALLAPTAAQLRRAPGQALVEGLRRHSMVLASSQHRNRQQVAAPLQISWVSCFSSCLCSEAAEIKCAQGPSSSHSFGRVVFAHRCRQHDRINAGKR